MKLTSEQIIALTVGAVEHFVDDEGVHFYRNTKEQRDFWASRSEFLGNGAKCTTGVRLDFETDASQLRFTVSAGRYDVLIDGLLRKSCDWSEAHTEELDLTDPLGRRKEKTRVTLTLPSHGTGGIVKEIELTDGTYANRHNFDRKIIFFGDSITQGWDSERNALSYAYQVSLDLNAESVIQGIGGSYFHEDSFVDCGFDPDIVIVAYGTNDYCYYQTADEIRVHAFAFMQRVAVCYEGKTLVCITPTWRGDALTKTMPCGSFVQVRKIIAEEAKKLDFFIVDGLEMIPPMAQFFLSDLLHPNPLGFTTYAKNLLGVLQGIVGEESGQNS